jgi:DNA-binding MarR family transcriptional regulator
MADQNKFARSLLTMTRGLGRIVREQARAGEVTLQQADTLQIIAERGSVSTSLLATTLGIDPSTASRNLSGLEKAGLIAREKGATDGRQTDVKLTARGRRAAQNIGAGTKDAFSALLERVPRADRSRVAEALEVLSQALEQHADADDTE